MKKLFLLAVGLAMTLTACQKDEGLVSDVATTSSFTVTIPQSGVQTRAVTDAFGTGTSVNRCILEIYHGDKLYDRIEKGVSGKTVTFDNLRLVSSQTYDFVFWADCAEGSEGNFTDKVYNTANLKSITEIGPFVGNSDERDAFFAKESFKVTGSFTKPVTLKRPFGLLVVKTNDLNEIKDEALKPTGYSVAFKGLPTTFNALTGEVSGSADVTYTAGELAKADGTISMDFLWATESEAALSDFTMTFYHNDTEICTNDAFTNIPIRRNYRTNVSGNLLTKQGTLSVTIDPDFEQPDIAVTDVATAGALVAALQDPNVATINVTADIDLSAQSVEDLTFATHKTIDIEEGATVRLGKTNRITAKEGLTLTGGGTIDNTSVDNSDLEVSGGHYPKSLIHVESGECLIDGVTLVNDLNYHWHGSTAVGQPYNSAAIAYWSGVDMTIRNALAHYTTGGAMGRLLDAESDNLGLSSFMVFEIEELMRLGTENLVPVLLYLFHRIEKALDGKPTLLVLDEAWVMLGNDVFRDKIREWLKVLRKANCAVVLATQSLSDAKKSNIMDVLVESCLTKIYLANPYAEQEEQLELYRDCGLNSRQISIIARGTQKRDYYMVNPYGRRQFQLALGKAELAFVGASDKESLARIHALRLEYGDEWPQKWLLERNAV